jgi:hypothetical protein
MTQWFKMKRLKGAKPTNIMINNRPNGKSSYGLFIWNCRYFGGRVGLSDIIRGHPRLPQFSL